jgi:hypothetical protein
LAKHELNGKWYTPKELSEMSGVLPHTIRDRLRRGYSVEEAIKVTSTQVSVKAFAESSWYEDWIGMSTNDLHKIYWKWCIEHGYSPIQIQGFTRQLFGMYPMLKTVPTKKGDRCFRVI